MHYSSFIPLEICNFLASQILCQFRTNEKINMFAEKWDRQPDINNMLNKMGKIIPEWPIGLRGARLTSRFKGRKWATKWRKRARILIFLF